MKKIVVKEVDKLASAVHKNRIVTEYLLYVMIDGNVHPLEAYTELGETNKNARINELLLLHFVSEDPNASNPNKEDIIEEVSFENYIKEMKKLWKK